VGRNAIQRAALALLGVLALAVAAATLPSAVRTERGASRSGDGGGGLLPPPPENSPVGTVSVAVPDALGTAVLFLFALAIVASVFLYRESLLRRALRVIALIGALFVFAYLFSLFLAHFELSSDLFGRGLLGGEGGSPDGRPASVPSVLFGFLLLCAALGAAAALFLASRQSSEQGADGPEPDVTAAVGRVAGRAADRLEDDPGDVENEVYRAWREMTALLDLPDPETNTPGEFAVAATEAGMDGGDVRELTRLFEDVRYGGSDPTPGDERRAVTIFREVESAYAGGAEVEA